jgi:TPR repeat protein
MRTLNWNAVAMFGIAVASLAVAYTAAGLAPRLASQPAASLERGIAALRAFDYDAARRDFAPLAGKGNPQAEIWLAHMDADGLGAPADGTAAAALLNKAAASGSAEAARRLGELYRDGTSVLQDLGKARAALQRAADAGDAVAERELGELYAQGAGVEKDPRQAYAWLALAASHGDRQALAERDRIGATLSPAQLAAAEQQAQTTKQQISTAAAPAGKTASQAA